MADFFNDGDQYSGRAKSEALTKIAVNADNEPDFFKEEVVVEQEAVEEKEEEVEIEASQESQEPIKEVEQPTISAKELAALYGGKEYRLPADSKFKHKADGQDIDVSLQELLNNYSGKTSWDKKYSELDKDKQAYKKDLESVQKYLNEFATKAKTDRIGAFEFLAGAAGIDPLEFRRNIRKDLLEANKNYLSMDEQSRASYELKEENDYYRDKRESEKRKMAEEQTHREFENQINATKQSHGISDERLSELVNDLKQYGGIDKPSMDDVVNLNIAYNRQDRAMGVLNKINPELMKDDKKLIALESLLTGNSSLSDEELNDYATKLWGSNKKVVPKKQPQTVQKTPAKPNTMQKRTIGGGNFNFFD